MHLLAVAYSVNIIGPMILNIYAKHAEVIANKII